MVNFIMLVGLPASGKSTLSNKIKERIGENCEILSSDNLREELFGDINCQDKNGELFDYMNKKTREYLKNGISVIYDATNINSKRRKNLLKTFNKILCRKVCIYVATPVEECIKRDEVRDKKVGSSVIYKMYNNMQIPMVYEGWDNIEIHSTVKYKVRDIDEIINLTYNKYKEFLENNFPKCLSYNQNNPHHDFTLDEHMYRTYKYIRDNEQSISCEIASILHDVGKPLVEIKDDNGISHYRNHDNISAQESVLLLDKYFTSDIVIEISTLIQLHMRMFDKCAKNKLKNELSEEMYKNLELLHEADINSCKNIDKIK